MKSICVFCGSNFGRRPAYEQAAIALGTAIAQRGWRLVYGGSKVGLMGAVADAALVAGGPVVGVLPAALSPEERGHRGLTELHIVDSMHERKARMAELADAFVALPGGLGTFEELLEVTTWTQLGLHRKACGLVNVEGYYDGLLTQADRALADGFLTAAHRSLLLSDAEPTRVLDLVTEREPPLQSKLVGLRSRLDGSNASVDRARRQGSGDVTPG